MTLSYLNETFMDTIMDRVDEKIAQRDGQTGGAAASSFSVVTLTSGDNNVMGIRKKIPANCARPLIEIMGEHSIVEEAGKLLDYSLDIYREIQDHCPFPGWKRGLKEEVYIVK